MIHTGHTCKSVCLLTFTHDPETHAYGTFTVIHRAVQCVLCLTSFTVIHRRAEQ